MQNGVNAYKKAAIQSTPQDKLLIMLYDHAIRYLKVAKDACATKDYEATNDNLLKAQDIVTELIVQLNMEYEVAQSLYRLYDYFRRRLIEANMQKNMKHVDEVIGHLTELRETWIQAALIIKQEGTNRGLSYAG
ncbi:MAG: flagellar export chaperone FliS [Peptococcaceae bacterium]|nr:flagellar export chaperone FliS [Peptococcaceae bacterium]